MKYPKLAWKTIETAANGLSQAEIAHAAEEAVKAAILSERNSISTTDLSHQLQKRQNMKTVFIDDKGSIG